MMARSRRISLAAAVTAAVALLYPVVPAVHARATLDVIATGLLNPRGLAFGPEGALYVAEAGSGGSGPCITVSDGRTLCYGATGAITRISELEAGHQTRIATGLPSLAPSPSAQDAGTRALGPHDIGFLGRGNGWVTIGLGANPALRANLGSVGTRFGRLLRMLPNGRTEYAEDLADYEADANPDGGAHDSNPYGIAVLPSRTLYADAGGNAVNEVAANGDISTFAVFPNRTVPSPFPPPGSTLSMQAVPTTVVEGPDGWIYVGQLTGFPFPVGGARVYRVPPEGGTPQVYADGFTNIIDIAFGADGSLYVLEIDSTSLRLGDSTGALIKIAPNGTRTTIASAGMIMPGGVAIARDGGIYVTLFSVFPGGGQVVRVNP